jgi:hypothetical protein
MRVAILVAASMVLVCASAAAQTDEISLYSDPGYNNCELVDNGSGLVYVYVVHHISSGAVSSQFMIREGAGSALSYLGHQSEFRLTLGDPLSGMAVSYEKCLNSDVLVTVLSYFKSGSSDKCSYLQIVPDPSTLNEWITVFDCFESRLEASGSRLVINPDGSCACGPTTEITNWGRIKDRFRD